MLGEDGMCVGIGKMYYYEGWHARGLDELCFARWL